MEKQTMLAKFMDENKINRREIADILSISKQQVSNLSLGKSELSRQYIRKLVKHYDLPWDYFYIDEKPSMEAHENHIPYEKDQPGKTERSDIITMAIQILTSGTHYENSLKANINSFYKAIEKEKVLEIRIAHLEQTIKKLPSGNMEEIDLADHEKINEDNERDLEETIIIYDTERRS